MRRGGRRQLARTPARLPEQHRRGILPQGAVPRPDRARSGLGARRHLRRVRSRHAATGSCCGRGDASRVRCWSSLVWREHGLEEQKLFLSMMLSCGICFVHREAGDDDRVRRDRTCCRSARRWRRNSRRNGLRKAPIESATFDYELLHPGLVRTRDRPKSAAGPASTRSTGGAASASTRPTRAAAAWSSRSWSRRPGTHPGPGPGRPGRRRCSIGWRRSSSERRQRLSIAPMQAPGGYARVAARLVPVALRAKPRPSPPLDFRQPPVGTEEWYVSYAWGDATPEGREREAVVDRLCDEAAGRGIRIQRDKTSARPGRQHHRHSCSASVAATGCSSS